MYEAVSKRVKYFRDRMNVNVHINAKGHRLLCRQQGDGRGLRTGINSGEGFNSPVKYLFNHCTRYHHYNINRLQSRARLRRVERWQHFGYDVVDVSWLSLGMKLDNVSNNIYCNGNDGAATNSYNKYNGSDRLSSSRIQGDFKMRASASGERIIMGEDDSDGTAATTAGGGSKSGGDLVFHRIFAATIRATLFYALSLLIAFPIFIFMIIIWPLVYVFDRHRRMLYGKLNTFWATMSTLLFFKVEVEGKENLPNEDEAVVYVANHASYLVRLFLAYL